MNQVLLIDDEQPNLEALARIVEREGFKPIVAHDALEAMDRFSRSPVPLVVTDLKMPGFNGIEVVRRVKALRPETEVIVVTAHGTIETAVEAVKEGAYDFITKPFDRMTITRTMQKAMEKQSLMRENFELRQTLQKMRSGHDSFQPMVGQSVALRRVLELIEQVADSEATVLIIGESGVGKELAAEALHHTSQRADQPFVKISCTTLPEALLEAELFGYEKGAFTGAIQRRQGRFEVAGSGTVFLDEIGDLPSSIQGKLLRVLQEGAFERLGSNKTLKSAARVVAATNRNLEQLVREGSFREDLYYRLNVIQLNLPALRDRHDDIPLLVDHFVRIYAAQNNKQIRNLSDRCMQRLMRCDWPGNVRQLKNAIERAVVLSSGSVVEEEHLPPLSESGAAISTDQIEGPDGRTQRNATEPNPEQLSIPVGTSLAEVERQMIEATLAKTKGDKQEAARLLGITARTIYRKLEPR